jgi:Zn-dependent alcohol dehydrogenases
MRAMVLHSPGHPLQLEERPDPEPGPHELVLRIQACAVCRTDLHVVDGELPHPHLPVVPGHEIVGIVERVGAAVHDWRIGERAGVPWLGHVCGRCEYCTSGRENLCDSPLFTGYSRDGGFATHVAAEAAFCFRLDQLAQDAAHAAPLLCAGLIGWRSLKMAGEQAGRLGLYGLAPPRTSSRRSPSGQAARSSPSRGRETSARSRSPARSARRGPAAPTSIRRSRSMRRSSSRRSALSFPPRCARCAKAAAWSAAAST